MIAVTTDIEWSPEPLIRDLFDLADSSGVDLFPFVTHRSEYLRSRGGPMGVHPNFLPGSTHGGTEEEVVEHVLTLAPNAKAYRPHCFYDHTRLQWKMLAAGFRVDSNACAFLQYVPPYTTATGVRRYPVYWTDDVHRRQGRPDCFDPAPFDRPELLVVNVHPASAGSAFVRDLFRFARGRSVPFAGLCD